MSFVGQRNTSTLFLSRLLVHSYFSTRVLARVIEGSIRVKTDTQFDHLGNETANQIQGLLFAALIVGTARNPFVKAQLYNYAILGFALAEAVGLFALMMAFLILYG